MALPKPHFGRPLNRPDWPTNDFEGAIKALGMWIPDPRLDYSGCPSLPHRKGTPFSSENLKSGCVRKWINGVNCYIGTQDLYPDHPNAVAFFINFIHYSFGINLITEDPDEIARMRAAIAGAMARPEYAEYAIRESQENARRFGEAWQGWPPGHPCHGIDKHVLVQPKEQPT